jgi:hypothetical protein
MKHASIAAILFVVATACGGGGSKPSTTTQPVTSEPAAAEPAATPPAAAEPAPAPEPAPPPPPKVFAARAELAPVKGAKQKAAAIKFTETEGQEATSVTSDGWFEGLAPGKYHLVVHAGAECGTNAAKAGKAWDAAQPIGFEVAKDKTGNVDAGVPLKVQGDQAVVGKTLVLSADKGGKPGKVLACGPIAAQ